MSAHYYNDFDPKPCRWLLELGRDGHVPKGYIDNRSIADIQPHELKQYTQCHFFAGIGGWPYALRLAGWTEDEPVWTGSCPCQPFSCAGKGLGTSDERHLWPQFLRLIAECRPPVIFGEQVASKAGREWLAGVRADLEALGYEVGAADLCAAGVGAPHIRQRLFWVAYSRLQRQTICEVKSSGFEQCGKAGGLGHPEYNGPLDIKQLGTTEAKGRVLQPQGSGAWSNYATVPCRDNKTRPFEPGSFPLAHGVPNRVGLLRGYGNAIVPQVAATFIRASVEAINDSQLCVS